MTATLTFRLSFRQEAGIQSRRTQPYPLPPNHHSAATTVTTAIITATAITNPTTNDSTMNTPTTPPPANATAGTPDDTPLLQITHLTAYHGTSQTLRDLTLTLHRGEILCLFGRNGAGKSTTLRAIVGQLRRRGSIRLNGRELTTLPAHAVAALGIGYVPQGRRLFAELSVSENLDIGLLTHRQHRQQAAATRDQVLTLFPALRPRLQQISGTLSGGEQQMLAMARALCLAPSVLLLDEPTEGLMPSMVTLIRQVLQTLRRQGVGIILVEQRVDAVLPIADRAAFLENGSLVQTLTATQLRATPQLLQRYVGVG